MLLPECYDFNELGTNLQHGEKAVKENTDLSNDAILCSMNKFNILTPVSSFTSLTAPAYISSDCQKLRLVKTFLFLKHLRNLGEVKLNYL